MEKKSGAPDEDKSVHDSKLLIPTLKDFFEKHPLLYPKTFLGDAAFDTVQLYKDILTRDAFGDSWHFERAYIPLNARAHLKNADYTINKDGIPCCPHNASLPMKPEGSKSNLRSGLKTLSTQQFVINTKIIVSLLKKLRITVTRTVLTDPDKSGKEPLKPRL